jgi:hypothetical protein
VVAAVVLVALELVAALAEVLAQLVGAVVAVAELVLVEEVQVLPLSAPQLLAELLWLPTFHYHQARRRLCSLRQCRPL